MTVNDIYKCSNIDASTRFIIDARDTTNVYDGQWHNMAERLKNAKVQMFSILRFDHESDFPYVEEVFVALAE